MTATEISRLLSQRVHDLCAHLLPNGEDRGGEWCVGSLSGEPGGSLKIPLHGPKLGMFRDFAGDDTDKGDLLGLWKSVKQVDLSTACQQALEWLNVPQEQRNGYRTIRQPPAPKAIDAHWTELQSRLRKGSIQELQALADQRKLGGTAGLERATALGQLFFTDVYDHGERHPAWILTDSARLNGQARKIDGTEWRFDGKRKPAKSKTVWSPEAGWPIGINDVGNNDIVLVEGNPDFLAAHQAIWMAGRSLSPVGVFGASTVISDEALPLFAGKTVYLMAHSEESGVGLKAAQRWERQLKSAGANTVLKSFGQDGVKDLNDLLSLSIETEQENLITGLWPEPVAMEEDWGDGPPVPAGPPMDRLASKRVRLASKPQEPITRLFLAGKPIATPGNLVTLISRAKTGKTATIGAATAAIIGAHYDRHDLDTFGFTAPHNREAVILIDTEQSPYDAWTCHQRALARSGGEQDPDWLCHFALVGESAEQLGKDLISIITQAKKDHGGIFTIILDGVADFVNSVNDEAECNNFITWLRSIAVQYDCPIICVIHSNEAIKSGDDGRGHLGKQLTRKAESNLLLKKEGDVTTITSEKQRKAPITEADGIAFRWSDQAGRHVSCTIEDSGSEHKKGGRKPIYQLSRFIEFFPGPNDNHVAMPILWNKCRTIADIPRNTFRDLCEREFQTGELDRLIDKNMGPCYRLNPTPH